MSDDIVTRLRDHARHAVHDFDDDCAEAADAIESLARDLHEARLLANRLIHELSETRGDRLSATLAWTVARNERKELLAEVVQLRARVRELEANGPDPLGGRMDV